VMRQLAREGMTMMVVTHEIGFAREVADSWFSWRTAWLSNRARRSKSWAIPKRKEPRPSCSACQFNEPTHLERRALLLITRSRCLA
jgi:hypothetical protein